MYTGTVYEIFLKDGSITSSIGSGGRYDNIIGAFRGDNMHYPTVGISFGLDVIYTALSQKETVSSTADVFIIPLRTELQCLQLAQQLRSTTSLKVELELAGRKLKRALIMQIKRISLMCLLLGKKNLVQKPLCCGI